ncbi:hypothetical protein VB296_07270 [Enterobacter cloacae]|uniref:hypothetical protein n=1 Tax=Enterobacter cloacae TaxID=550 RepID=UPI002B20C52C|nr:hypothetical protein [Enterobacter cloacae]MEA5222677.1 hypothetical protein [Enterobacter cloacae]
MFHSKKALVFCPKFFSYDIEIKKAIENQGYSVELHDERPSTDLFIRALIRFGFNAVLKRKIENYYLNIFNSLNETVDILIIINPESITPELLKKFRGKCKNIVVYMWDSFKNKPQAKNLIPHADSFYTFDVNDSQAFNIKFKPLFYSDIYKIDELQTLPRYDISFIGTVHSSRYEYVKKISHDFNSYTFFFCPSHFVFFYKKYITREIKKVAIKDVSFKSLSVNDVISVVANSKCILDISHPLQQGLTMRSIETMGAKRKLITTNKSIVNYDFFDEDNILVVDNAFTKHQVEHFLQRKYKSLEAEIYNKYSVNYWVQDFLRDS